MITFSSVTKQFTEDALALDDVSFHIEAGEFVIITGHSGSGKTTLMRLLTKEYTPTAGDIVFEDQELREIRPGQVHHHRRKIGVVFQDYKLLSELNVWENIALALNIMGKAESEIEVRVTDLLRLVGLVEKAFLFPSQLSGGEAQRVSIARALATGPSLIFADEPTGNLDPDTSAAIARLLKKINSLGTTIMLATHDSGVLETLSSHRRLHLDKGKLVKDTGALTKTAVSASAPNQVEISEEDQPETEDTEDIELQPPKANGRKFLGITLPFGRRDKTSNSVTDKDFHDDKNDEDTVEITVKVEKL